MSWTFLREEKRKARKVHQCDLCLRDIAIGDSYIARSGIDDVPVTMKMHEKCEEATHDWDVDDWEYRLEGKDFIKMCLHETEDAATK